MADRKEVQVVTLRMPAEEHAAVKAVAAISGRSINDLVLHAVREFLTGEHRAKEFDRLLSEARSQYRVALDKLRDL